jgi:phage gp29-like protein
MEERDMHYGAVLGIRKRTVSGVRPTVKAVDDSARQKEIAAGVERDIAGHTGFRSLVKDLLDALGKSYAAVEIDWQTGARWKPRRFIFRDPRFFTFGDDQEELRLLTPPPTSPRSSSSCFRTAASDAPTSVRPSGSPKSRSLRRTSGRPGSR